MSLFLKLKIKDSLLMRSREQPQKMKSRDQPQKLTLNQKCIDYKCILYVLKLQKGRYYVGKSENQATLKKRIQDHRAGRGKGAEWTKLFPVVEQMKNLYEYNCSPFEEDRKVKQLMYIFGINMVRGGTYCRTVDLSKEECLVILKEFKGATNQCYRCGKLGHFVKNCPQRKKEEAKQQNKNQQRAEENQDKKQQQDEDEMIEKKKGTQKKQEKKYDFIPLCKDCHGYGHYNCDFNKYDQEYKKKYKGFVKCYNCNQYGHFADECDESSSHWSDSNDWSSDWSCESSQVQMERSREKNQIACYICGNPNHLRPDCPFNEKYKYKKRQYFTENRSSRSNTCNYCKRQGHWYADCWLRKNNKQPYRSYSDSDSDDNSF